MKSLNLKSTCAIVFLTDSDLSTQSLVDQCRSYLEGSNNILLDTSNIKFTSMLIGELANLVKSFDGIWNSNSHHMAMINVTPSGKEVFTSVNFDKLVPMFDSSDEALNWMFGSAEKN